MMPERFDTIDTINPIVMRVGRNPVVGGDEHHPKRCIVGRSQPKQNAPTNAQRLVGHHSSPSVRLLRSASPTIPPLDQATQPQSP